MRGLDDALDRLARRDELRRRAAGEATGTPPAVTELVEAIAAVVGRNPELAVTVGVEGAGDPVLLHFALEDGIVQVSADNSVVQRASEAQYGEIIDVEVAQPVAEPAPQVTEPAPQVTEPAPLRETGHHRYEQPAPQPQHTMPSPLPEPVPLHVDEQETELAAQRLAAMLREDPSLLHAQD
ncbi:hypothetical protein [Couchioplanes caeruleus]|uniref:Uncharacterized protein n=2 Tax=Couchioplanes caeruleus TaxID=56438 RepID=A0A1K0FAN1_9ACTN|nr:hypothetical protein [Couchioplanes caeruleus]OJF09808.1 hypothetical protein BG844_35665 [Couchioplanes caeruleus subsp. caeruleus]ROP31410.1 hypothetical protein EDD30_4310 [Couchioplanes caeruleus]